MNGFTGTEQMNNAYAAEGEDLMARATDVVGEARATYERVKDEALERAAEVDLFVRHRPYAAAGIAVLAGIVLGHLLSAGRPRVIVLRDGHAPRRIP
ncbi:MAG: hypothetical protein ABIO39_12150 [Caulobacteraceae bacterium]